MYTLYMPLQDIVKIQRLKRRYIKCNLTSDIDRTNIVQKVVQ